MKTSMGTYRDPATREPADAATTSPRPLRLRDKLMLGGAALVVGSAFVVPFVLSWWQRGLGFTLLATAMLLAAAAVPALIGLRIRAWSEARTPDFARDRLAQETEAFLTRTEDEAIRARVFLPPTRVRIDTEPAPASEESPPHLSRGGRSEVA